MNLGNRWDRFAILVVLVAMGVSRPLLDLLGENAEFFLARRSPRIDIVVVGLVLGLGVPLVIGILAVPGGRLGRLLSTIVAFVLATVLARLALVVTPLPDWGATLGAIAGGAAIVWALARFQGARQLARYLLPAPLLFTVLFFFFTPTAAVMAGEGTLTGADTADRAAPLVWIVLDELPAASLMDAEGEIYAERFPNFGRLADDGIWFSNTVTVQQQTEHSVPAILTGNQVDRDLAPFAGQYPNNIFIALSESHDLAVFESVTHLCPAALCNSTEEIVPAEVRAELLATDIAIVAGHTLLPEVVSDDLPPINQGWGYFGAEVSGFNVIDEFWESFNQDPRRPLEATTARIGDGFDGRPPFLFVHALVPHHPWQLLPTGQRYVLTGGRTPGTTSTGWGSDQWLIDQGLQRHLVNVGYADHALGEILDALDEAGLYEEAMIVLVADHGIAVRQNVEHQRTITPETIGEIAAVPLLIKVPGVEGGKVDHRRALTIDIVPTVAEVMGVELSWQPEGRSLLGRDPARTTSITQTPAGLVTYGVDGTEVLEVARRIARSFPDPDPFVLLPPGAPDLLGIQVDPTTLPASSLRFSLDEPEWYEEVELDGDGLPTRISGRIAGIADGSEIYAIVVNGKVAAMTRGYEEASVDRLQAMIPPSALRQGVNTVLVALWDGEQLLSVERIR